MVRFFLFIEQIECNLIMPSTTSQPYIVELQSTSIVVTCQKTLCRGLLYPLYDVLVMFEILTCRNPTTSVEFCNLVPWEFNCSCWTNLWWLQLPCDGAPYHDLIQKNPYHFTSTSHVRIPTNKVPWLGWLKMHCATIKLNKMPLW